MRLRAGSLDLLEDLRFPDDPRPSEPVAVACWAGGTVVPQLREEAVKTARHMRRAGRAMHRTLFPGRWGRYSQLLRTSRTGLDIRQ